MEDKLKELDLNHNNSVVIGSGILQALGIRNSKDIDLVVPQKDYNRLRDSGQFSIKVSEYTKKEILTDDLFEIGTSWEVLDKSYEFNDFIKNSIVIDGVRYVTLDFLYEVKNSWVQLGTSRPKDIDDLQLIKQYKEQQSNL